MYSLSDLGPIATLGALATKEDLRQHSIKILGPPLGPLGFPGGTPKKEGGVAPGSAEGRLIDFAIISIL